MNTYTVSAPEQLPATAAQFLADRPAARIFAFTGELGAGKTTFIKALCTQLGVKDVMSSPSFSIVNEYHDAKKNPVYHFDLYRIKSPAELEEIGFEEYLFSGSYCFIEWPEKAEGMLPEETVNLHITENRDKRTIVVR